MPEPPASRRCWIRKPEGPGAVSAGKLRRARATVLTYFISQREGSQVRGWRRLRWAQSPEGSRCLGVVGAEAGVHQRVAGFPVETFPRKADGELAALFFAELLGGAWPRAVTVVPKTAPLTFSPPSQPVHRVGGPSMAAAGPRRGSSC